MVPGEGEVPEFAATVDLSETAEGERASVPVEVANGVSFPPDKTIALLVTGTASASDYTEVSATPMLRARKTLATAMLARLKAGPA